jgi:hypothetical protein
MKPQEIIDRSIIAKALQLREGQVRDISTGSSKYLIRIYKNKQLKIILSLVNFINKKKKVIGYYLSEQVDKELTVDYPKSDYSIYMYEDIQKMIEKDKTYEKIISDSEKSIKELKENISIENILEPKKENNSKLIQSLKRELNIIELKIQKEELLKRIEDAS